MTATNTHQSAVSLQRRNVCGALVLSCLGVATTAGAATSSVFRPELERFIKAAQLPTQSRLWARNFANIAKSPSHPLHGLVELIQTASDSALLVLLVETFQNVTEEDAKKLVAVLETPSGQWIVQMALWSQEFFNSFKGNPAQGRENMPRQLSETEIHAIQEIGMTPSWQALRRAGNATLFGSELMIGLDSPQAVGLLLSR